MSECRQDDDAKLLARVLSEDAPGLHELLVFGENTARFVEYATLRKVPSTRRVIPGAAPVPICGVLSAYESAYPSPARGPAIPAPDPRAPPLLSGGATATAASAAYAGDDPAPVRPHDHGVPASLHPDHADVGDDDLCWDSPPPHSPDAARLAAVPELKRKRAAAIELRARLSAFLRCGALYADCGVPRGVWDGARAVRRVSPLLAAASGYARAAGVRTRGRAGVRRFSARACLAALYEARLQCVSVCHDLQGSAVDVCFEPTGRVPLLLACSVTGNVADAQQSVAAAATHTAVLYNYRTGCAWPLEAHGNHTVSAVGFVDGSTKALSAGFDGNLCLWDIARCSSRESPVVPLVSQVKLAECIELFQVNERLGNVVLSVVGKSTHTRDSLVLTNIDDCTSEWLARGYGSCNDAAWTHLGDRVVATFENGSVGIFPVCGGGSSSSGSSSSSSSSSSGARADVWRGTVPVTDVSCARSMPLFATGLSVGRLMFWDERAGVRAPVAECAQMRSEFNHLSFSTDDLYLQASMEDSHVYVFDVRALARPLHVFAHEPCPHASRERGDSLGVTMSRWTRQGFLFSCGADGAFKVWDLRAAGTDALLRTVRAHCFSVSCVDVSPDGTVVASGCDGNRLALHSIAYEDPVFAPITDQFDPLAAEFGPLKLP